MNITLTRQQVLTLMTELDEGHWLQPLLLDALNHNTATGDPLVISPAKPATAPEPVKAKVAAKDRRSISSSPVETRNKPQSDRCRWETYGWYCNRELVAGSDWCAVHDDVQCAEPGCTNQTDHGCPAEMQFVCGAPLCKQHTMCSGHGVRHW